MRIITLSIFSILLFVSCENFQNNEKKDIISRDTFVSVLIDMHLTEVILLKEHRMDRNLKDSTGKKSYYNFLYKKYNINEYRFTKTVDYYSHHCDKYSLIYKDVIDELSQRRSNLDSIRKQKIEARRDSLNSIMPTKNDSLATDSIKRRKINKMKNIIKPKKNQ